MGCEVAVNLRVLERLLAAIVHSRACALGCKARCISARKARSYILASLERIRVQIVAREQLVKVRAIAFCQASRLTHIAHRDLQNL